MVLAIALAINAICMAPEPVSINYVDMLATPVRLLRLIERELTV
jgi:hypothetical protein